MPESHRKSIDQILINLLVDNTVERELRTTAIKPRLAPLENIRAVVFDIYGTLFISGLIVPVDKGLASVYRQVLEACGIEINPSARAEDFELYAEYSEKQKSVLRTEGIENPEVDILEIWRSMTDRWLAEGAISGRIDTTVLEKLSVEFEICINPPWPMPGFRDLIPQPELQSLRLGIVSNAHHYVRHYFPAFCGGTLEELGFDPELICLSSEIGSKKPSAQIFKPLLDKLQSYGYQPSQALYVGNDMYTDIWAASRLGMRTALIVADQRTLFLREGMKECQGLEPDVIITDLRQLRDVLKQNTI